MLCLFVAVFQLRVTFSLVYVVLCVVCYCFVSLFDVLYYWLLDLVWYIPIVCYLYDVLHLVVSHCCVLLTVVF